MLTLNLSQRSRIEKEITAALENTTNQVTFNSIAEHIYKSLVGLATKNVSILSLHLEWYTHSYPVETLSPIIEDINALIAKHQKFSKLFGL